MKSQDPQKTTWFWTPSKPPGKEEDPPMKSLFSQILEYLVLLIVALAGIKMLYAYLLANKIAVWIAITTVVVVIVLYRLIRHNRDKDQRY